MVWCRVVWCESGCCDRTSQLVKKTELLLRVRLRLLLVHLGALSGKSDRRPRFLTMGSQTTILYIRREQGERMVVYEPPTGALLVGFLALHVFRYTLHEAHEFFLGDGGIWHQIILRANQGREHLHLCGSVLT